VVSVEQVREIRIDSASGQRGAARAYLIYAMTLPHRSAERSMSRLRDHDAGDVAAGLCQ
jgi:hypothetical protein